MSTIQSGGYDSMQYEPVEQRTSVMAILSLVFGLLCVPGLGVLGAIFGIAALFTISGSRGRVGGKGLAVAGLVISVLVSVIWLAVFVGAAQVASMFQSALVTPANTTMQAIDAGQADEARKTFAPSATQKITDADFTAFRDAYQAELGAYKGMPQGWGEIFGGYAKVGPLMEKYQQNSGDIIPLPANFEKGMGLVVFQIDQASTNQGGTIASFVNIIVVGPSGAEFTLYDPTNRVPGAPDAPGTDPATPDSPPDKPEEPAGPG